MSSLFAGLATRKPLKKSAFQASRQSKMEQEEEDYSGTASDEEGVLMSKKTIKVFDPDDYDIEGITKQELCDLKEAFDLFSGVIFQLVVGDAFFLVSLCHFKRVPPSISDRIL